MQKILIRIFAVIILISPWLYVGETLRDVISIVAGLVILLNTVDVSKKKKEEDKLI